MPAKVVMNRCPKIEYGRLVRNFMDGRELADPFLRRAQILGKGVQRMRLGPASKNNDSG
jgi:hypothetical protein